MTPAESAPPDAGAPPVPAAVAAAYRKAAAWGEKNLTMSVLLVTPETAADWLARETVNRPLGPHTVKRYVHYMRKGDWSVNGEPLILDDKERVLDGQHRLRAVCEAGVAVPFVAIIGVDKEAFYTLNSGRVRSAADTLFTVGEKRARALASALLWLHRYESGSMLARSVRLSNLEIAKLLEEFPGVRASVEFVHPRCQKGLHAPGPFSFLHYACLRRHPGEGAFFNQVLSGAELTTGSVAHKLYLRLVSLKEGGGSGGARSTKALEVIALFIKAWNAHVHGRSLGLLKWAETEDFPEIA